jgi:hypothetical protein
VLETKEDESEDVAEDLVAEDEVAVAEEDESDESGESEAKKPKKEKKEKKEKKSKK